IRGGRGERRSWYPSNLVQRAVHRRSHLVVGRFETEWKRLVRQLVIDEFLWLFLLIEIVLLTPAREARTTGAEQRNNVSRFDPNFAFLGGPYQGRCSGCGDWYRRWRRVGLGRNST